MRTTFVAAAGILSLLSAPLAGRQQALQSPAALVLRGDTLAADGRFNAALDAYRLAVGAPDPDLNFRAGTGVVTMLLRLGDFDAARDAALAFRASAPDTAGVHALAGDALWAAGLFLEAEADYAAALALDPGLPRARHGLARSLASRSRLDEALSEAQAAARLEPGVAEYHHTLAAIFERLRRFDESADELDAYVALLPLHERNGEAAWSHARANYLRSFHDLQPFAFADPAASHTVPFRLEGEKIIVQGRVNGGPVLDFVVDTGSEQTVISGGVARSARVAPITYAKSAGVGEVGFRPLLVGRIDRLQIGTLDVANVTCLIKSPALRDLPKVESESFSPLALGLSMTIDYTRKVMTMAAKLPEAAFETTLPLRMHRLAVVPGTVSGTPVSFVVDTGGEVISISKNTAASLEAMPGVRQVPVRVYGSSGWDRSAHIRPFVDLAFANVLIPNKSVVVLDLDAPSRLLGFKVGGIVGHRFLRDYRVTIDLVRSELGLQPS